MQKRGNFQLNCLHRRLVQIEHFVLFVITSIIFYCLAVYIGAGYEGIVFNANDIIFSNDASLRLKRLSGPIDYSEISLRHPLKGVFWAPIIVGFASFFKVFSVNNAVLASIIFINVVALASSCVVANLWMKKIDIDLLKRLAVLVSFMLASSNIILLSPDHFTLSFCLMFTASYVAYSANNSKQTVLILIFLMLIIVGTTTSNIIFCFLLTFYFLHKNNFSSKIFNRSTYVYWGISVGVGFAIVFVYVYSRWERLVNPDNFTLRWLNFKLLEHPLDALYYSAASFIYPIVAPIPNDGSKHFLNVPHLCLEPWGVNQFSLIYGLAVICLIYVFIRVSHNMLIKQNLKPVWILCIVWVMFNCLFHNLWGDEFFLYTPHWGFSLFVLLLFLPNLVSTRKLFLLLAPIYINQIYFYVEARTIINDLYRALI